MKPALPKYRGAFLLLETMLGVAIFALGILALGKAMQNCLDAEVFRRQEQLVFKALENRMAEISGGAQVVDSKPQATTLSGRYAGITLRQWREAPQLENQEGNLLSNIYNIRLQAEWQGPGGAQTREISFYVYSTQ